MTKKKLNQPYVVAGLIGAMGVQVAICILIGYWLGTNVSDWTGNKGWLAGGVLTGFAIGIGSAILVVFKLLGGSDE